MKNKKIWPILFFLRSAQLMYWLKLTCKKASCKEATNFKSISLFWFVEFLFGRLKVTILSSSIDFITSLFRSFNLRYPANGRLPLSSVRLPLSPVFAFRFRTLCFSVFVHFALFPFFDLADFWYDELFLDACGTRYTRICSACVCIPLITTNRWF